ncbi:MAG: sugar phosphate isomerase/epimerase family protein [Catalinimonas sp.]
MFITTTRRNFLKRAAGAGLALGAVGLTWPAAAANELFFDISLAEWSLHRALQSGALDHLDFPQTTRERFGIGAVEYVSKFFKSTDADYLDQLKQRCADHNVRSVLIMVDGEGSLADLDAARRGQAVANHRRWVDAARHLGCHSIRANAYGEGTAEQVQEAAVDGLSRLTEYGAKQGVDVIVENHGGYSSVGSWLAGVIRRVDSPHCGTLPDFGNFHVREGETYDRYKGVRELMPWAKGVSAKAHEFDASGAEVNIDYRRMLRIVKEAGYTGHIGIEYEGGGVEVEGILATKRLLEKVGRELS